MMKLSAPASSLPGEGGEIRLNATYWVLLILATVFTVGIMLVPLLVYARRFPRTMDANGVTTRGGSHFSWAELERVVHTRVTVEGVIPAGSGVLLEFVPGKAMVNPNVIKNGGAWTARAVDMAAAYGPRRP